MIRKVGDKVVVEIFNESCFYIVSLFFLSYSFPLNSFTDDSKYIMKLNEYCSFPDAARLCKHIFLTNRAASIPLSLYVLLAEPTSAYKCFWKKL